MSNLDSIFRDLVIANRILAKEEVVDAYGHVSIRNPDNPNHFLIARSLAPDLVTAVDIVEKAGVVDTRYPAPPTSDAVVGLYCFPPDVFDVIARLEPSSRGELEITDVNRHYASEGRLDVAKVEGWWEDAGKHWQHLADIGRLVDETGANR